MRVIMFSKITVSFIFSGEYPLIHVSESWINNLTGCNKIYKDIYIKNFTKKELQMRRTLKSSKTKKTPPVELNMVTKNIKKSRHHELWKSNNYIKWTFFLISELNKLLSK